MTAESPMRAILVDDEELARVVLREELKAHADIEIVAECANGFEAVKAAAELQPDLVFLDIQMPKLDGFETLELIGPEVAVIFVTAYDEYAVRAFEVHAIDYLMKPFSSKRLAEALDAMRERLALRRPMPMDSLRAMARPGSEFLERVLIRDGAKVHVVAIDQVDYVEAQDDYVAFATGGKKLLKQQTMAELEKSLDTRRFVRVHRSYILNVDRLVRLEQLAKDSHVAVLKDGTKLPVSRSGYAKLNDRL